jgi:membrane protease YdiL (CAAX protease family)
VFPVTVRAVSPRTGALRLLALYAYAALCSAPAAVLLLLGGRGARAWADPAALGPAGQAGVLLAAALALGACTALALRSGFAHPLELGLPRPRPVPVAAGAVAAFLALRFGGPDLTPVFRHGVAGALLGAHHPVPLWLLCCLLLPAAQAAFFFGFLQTRLQECTPVWAAAVLPAAAFAISGPVTAVPLPGLVPAFALGLVLVGVRRATGAAGAALALAVGAAATLIALHVH